MTAFIALLIALLTVSVQSIKAATGKPGKELKNRVVPVRRQASAFSEARVLMLWQHQW